MAGFEESGLPGHQAIRDGFQGCTEPEVFISSFQQENCVLLSSLRPALQLLDLQGLKRTTFHQTVINDLSEQLLKQINEECSGEKLKELLDHTFQFIHVDVLRRVIMAIMKKVPELKPEYVEQISVNKVIYQECPIEVKRRVWMKKHPLFGEAVGPILNKYIDEKHNLLYSTENVSSRQFFNIPPRQRRQNPVIQELVQMIGFSIELYNLVLQFLRTLFLRTKQEHYCSLRAELLMAFHDADVKEVRQVDPCHKFTWCLDACIRDKVIDSKRLKELQTFLDSIKKGQEEVIGDIAMILCDPYATNTVACSILVQLSRLVKMDMLPRSSQDLMFLIRLLTLSVSAWNMIKLQEFHETPVNIDIITQFLPVLMSVMLDELNEDSTPVAIPESLWNFIEDDLVAQVILAFYVNHLIQVNKRRMCNAMLPRYSQTLKSSPVSSAVVNLLVHSMVRNTQQFNEPAQCALLFDQFLFVWLEYEDVLHHILRLLWCVHEHIDSQLIVRLLTATQPSSEHADVLHDLHAKLVDLIASSKVSTPSSMEQNNSLSPALQLSPALSSPGLPFG